ncbi:MAG: hypothetical protein LH485_05470 [Sphingomonas bacterium]|nr:hypothetical protein [Sphingomonas bacterium]
MVGRTNMGKGAGPKGTRLRASHKDGPQRIRINGAWWSDEAEALFLNHLAASCNVAASAAAAGFSANTAYNHRRCDPAFARKWQAALDQGYARLEMELVRHASSMVENFEVDPDAPFKQMTMREAIHLLALHRRHQGQPAAALSRQVRPLDEVRDSILRKLDAIEQLRLSGARPEDALLDIGAIRADE